MGIVTRGWQSLFLGASLFMVPAAFGQAAADLTPRYEPGKAARIVVEMKREDETTMLGGGLPTGGNVPGTIKQTATQRAVYDMKVAAVTPEETVISLVLSELVMSLEAPTGKPDKPVETIRYDSTAEDNVVGAEENMLYKAMRPIVGVELVIRLDKQGQITRVENMGLQAKPGVAGAYVLQLISPEQVKRRFGLLLCPKKTDGKAKVGDKWNDVTTWDSPPLGKMVLTVGETLKSAAADTATIELAGTFELTPLAEGQTVSMPVKSSDYSGTIDWDTKEGLVGSAKVSWTLVLEGSAQGMNMRRVTESSEKITRMPPAPPKPAAPE